MKHLTARGPWVSRLPVDLAVAAAYAVVAALAVPGTPTPLRVVIGLPLVSFVPGYVLLAVLFPRRADPGWGARLALSLVASLAVVSLLAVAVAAVADGIGVDAVLGSLAGFVLVGAVLGGVRRLRVPAEQRLGLPVRRAAALRDAVLDANRVDAVVTLALVVAVLVGGSALAFGLAAPDRGASYTEFALLAENESGDLVAGGYPTSFVAGESRAVTAAVTNHEGTAVEYTVVVEVQRVRPTGGDDLRGDDSDADPVDVVEQRELVRRSETVAAGDAWRETIDVAPALTGDDLRLAYYLYRGDAPADADSGTAYRRLHLRIVVGDGGNATATNASAPVGSGALAPLP